MSSSSERFTALVIALKHRSAELFRPSDQSTSPSTPSGPDASVNSIDPTARYLSDLLADTRQELSRVDSKASLLLAAVGVVLGAIVGALVASHWSPQGLGTGAAGLWWVGVAAAAAGVLWIAASVYPRIHPRRPAPRSSATPTYFADVAAFSDIDAFRATLDCLPDARERLISQTYVTSVIVQRKYVQLRCGLISLLVAIITCGLAVTINVFFYR